MQIKICKPLPSTDAEGLRSMINLSQKHTSFSLTSSLTKILLAAKQYDCLDCLEVSKQAFDVERIADLGGRWRVCHVSMDDNS